MSLQKLTWQQFNIENLDARTVRQLKKIYDRYVDFGSIEKYINTMLDSVKYDLTILITTLNNYKQQLFAVENFNIDNQINYYQNIINNIENEDYESLSIQELIDIPANIEILFEESRMLDMIKG